MIVEGGDTTEWYFVFPKILIEWLFVLLILLHFLFIVFLDVLKLTAINVDNRVWIS